MKKLLIFFLLLGGVCSAQTFDPLSLQMMPQQRIVGRTGPTTGSATFLKLHSSFIIRNDSLILLSAGTPGGSNTQLQYNNSGAFSGISGATTNGTVVTLTSPVINVTSDATGDMYYRNAGGLFTRLPIGTAGQHLTGGTIPVWRDTTTGGSSGITVNSTTITGGATRRIPFNDAGVYQEDAYFVWDKTNKRLGIGVDPPLYPLHVVNTINGNMFSVMRNLSGGASAQTAYQVYNDLNDYFSFAVASSGGGGYGAIAARDVNMYTTRNMVFMVDAADKAIKFAVGSGGPTEDWRISANGSLSSTGGDGTAILHLKAGTTAASTAPLKFTTGTSLTTAEAGAMEYTTPQLFFTNGRAVRQEIPQIQQSRVSADYEVTSNTTLANVTGLTVNVAASGTYRFEAILFTTSTNTGGVKFAVGGTCTATDIIYEALVNDGNTNAAETRASALGGTVGDVTNATAAYCKINGTITVNAAGTLTIQFAQNASSGTASVVKRGSTFVITEMN